MDIEVTNQKTISRKRWRRVKEIGAILLILSFYGVYRLSFVKLYCDKVITPAVAGLTVAYGKVSTAVYRFSGFNFGFVTIPPDSDFLYSVQLATFINQKKASPLFNLASDSRLSREKRERALFAILKFESVDDWIQPFLNDLPKGGLLGLYEEEAPFLNDLVKKIRSEGGIQQDLVRAYAEVVFAFMLQVPDAIVRKHALNWVSDILPEDAIFLIVSRLEREKDPEVQKIVESALLNLRAVSDSDLARELLIPHYKKPPWPGLRLPIATVLARLGYGGALEYVRFIGKSEGFPNNNVVAFRLAESGTSYPQKISVTGAQEKIIQQRNQDRQQQNELAWARYKTILIEERQKQVKEEKSISRDKEPEIVADKKERPLLAKKDKQPSIRIEKSESQPEIETEPKLEKKIDSAEKTAPDIVEPLNDKGRAPAALIPEDETVVDQTEKPIEKPAQEPPLQVALVPDDILPPPLEDRMPQAPKSLMNYVDMVFEVNENGADLYQNPGDGSATNVKLPKSFKGKAGLEMMIGDEHWYQVQTKLGNGWAKGKDLILFDLSPAASVPVLPTEAEISSPSDESRQELTYFEAGSDNVSYYEKPSKKPKKLGTLVPDTAYLAVNSEKLGVDRWFLLQIRSDEKGWVQGFELKLSNVQQPAKMKIPTEPLSQREKKSAFAAEWIKAGVKGVGVYSRPSIAGKLISQINPPMVYKVLEESYGTGKEWYKIELPGNKEGWVQSMDVSLTSQN